MRGFRTIHDAYNNMGDLVLLDGFHHEVVLDRSGEIVKIDVLAATTETGIFLRDDHGYLRAKRQAFVAEDRTDTRLERFIEIAEDICTQDALWQKGKRYGQVAVYMADMSQLAGEPLSTFAIGGANGAYHFDVLEVTDSGPVEYSGECYPHGSLLVLFTPTEEAFPTESEFAQSVFLLYPLY